MGVGLWTMRSTVERPVPHHVLYREFREAAATAEGLDFDSIWTSEHHFWHDGYCPSPLLALASAAVATERIGLGTCIWIPALRSEGRAVAQVAALRDLAGPRLELGVGLGHRDAEFDGFGLERRRRPSLFAGRLAALSEAFGEDSPRFWVGGVARPAIARAARFGMPLLLPQTLRPKEVEDRVAVFRAEGGDAPVGLLRDVWIGADDAAARREAEPVLRTHYREEAGAWWVLSDADGRDFGFFKPQALEQQIGRALDCAVVGGVGRVREELAALPPVDHLILRPVFHATGPDVARRMMEMLGEHVLGGLRG